MAKRDTVGQKATETPLELRLVPARFNLLFTDFNRLEQCPAAGAYSIEGLPREKPSYGMWWGIFAHRFLEYAALRGRDEALKYVSQKRLRGLYDMCAKVDVFALPEGRVELGYAYNPTERSAREVPKGRWDVDPETEWAGRLDLLAEREGCPDVIDWKTGDISESNPGTLPQLLGGALAARALWSDPWGLAPPGRERPRGYYVSLAQINSDGSIRWRSARLEEAELDDFDHRSRRVQLEVLNNRRRIEHEQPVAFEPGPACSSCELAPVCPAAPELPT